MSLYQHLWLMFHLDYHLGGLGLELPLNSNVAVGNYEVVEI